MRVAVTGASGFVGLALTKKIHDSTDHRVVALSRSVHCPHWGTVEYRLCGDLAPNTDWTEALSGVNILVHAAARAHVMREPRVVDSIEQYHAINVAGTLNLARQAAELGVKRTVFLSTIKINGETTKLGEPFRVADTVNPQNAYSASKLEAERGLYEISQITGMEVVCIRPPLVYGPGVKGNFLSMLHWLDCGLPLPLGAIHNQRSLVGLDNLIDLIITCLNHPAAANQTLLVSDDEDLSTTELLIRLGKALDRRVRLVPVPSTILRWGATIFGKDEVVQRLLGNLHVDIVKTKELLGWSPPVSVDAGLKKTVEWYLRQR